MATTDVGFLKPSENNRPGNVFTWIATVLACAYIVWSGTMLYLSTPIFINMFKSMGVELQGPAWFVMQNYYWTYPILFAGAAALVLAKQFYVREKWPNLSITLAAVLVVDMISRGIVWALYRPLFEFMEKVNK
jgi:hypothetical protein